MRLQSAILCAILLAMLSAATLASAACSKASLKGVYGYFHGRPGGIGTAVTVLVGQITADGAGNVSGSWTDSVTGTIQSGTFSGTYSISNNCTGSLTLNNEDQSPAHFNLVLDDGNKGFQMLQTDSGTGQPGYGIAQGAATCGLSGKKQTLATNFLGTLFPSKVVEGIVGQWTLDGKGHISGNQTLTVAGAISTVTVTGTYTMDGDCLGTVQVTPSGFSTMNFNTVLVDGGRELLLIEADTDTLVAGTAQE